MVGHGGSSAGSYLTDPTSPIPSHCASIVVTITLRVKVVDINLYCNFLSDYGAQNWTANVMARTLTKRNME